MYAEATKYLFSLLVRISKISRRQLSRSGGEELYANDMALFALLFCQQDPDGPVRLRMTDVSRFLMISKPAATQTVNHLVEHGFMERVSDEMKKLLESEGHSFFDLETNHKIEVMKKMDGSECFYGLGDKTGFLNKKGYDYMMWNSDIPDAHTDAFKSLYKSIPFFMTKTNTHT